MARRGVGADGAVKPSAAADAVSAAAAANERARQLSEEVEALRKLASVDAAVIDQVTAYVTRLESHAAELATRVTSLEGSLGRADEDAAVRDQQLENLTAALQARASADAESVSDVNSILIGANRNGSRQALAQAQQQQAQQQPAAAGAKQAAAEIDALRAELAAAKAELQRRTREQQQAVQGRGGAGQPASSAARGEDLFASAQVARYYQAQLAGMALRLSEGKGALLRAAPLPQVVGVLPDPRTAAARAVMPPHLATGRAIATANEALHEARLLQVRRARCAALSAIGDGGAQAQAGPQLLADALAAVQATRKLQTAREAVAAARNAATDVGASTSQ